MFNTKNILNRMMGLSLLASLGLVALLCGAAPALAATAPPLGLVQQFGVLGSSGVTANGTAVVNGDVGSFPTPSITGAGLSTVLPFTIHLSADAVVQQAQTDATAASVNLTGQGAGVVKPDNMTGLILTPGTYSFATGTPLLPAGATLTLNDPSPGKTGIFVFNVGASLTTVGTSVVTGTANPCNIYWNITSAATLGDNFLGNIIAGAGVTVGSGATLTGRAVSLTALVSMPGTGQHIQGCSTLLTAPVVTPPAGGVALSKAFLPTTIAPGGTSMLTITLSNNNAGAVTLASALTDTLPGTMTIAGPVTTTCGGTAPFGTIGTQLVTVPIGATIPGGAPGFCTVMVNVTAGAGSFTNTVDNLLVRLPTGGTVGNLLPASATLNPPVLAATSVPTLNEWGVIIFLLLAGLGSIYYLRKYRRV